MRIVRIKAGSIKEALERLKRELGSEAVVVSTRTLWEREGLRKKKYFEVAAAIEKEKGVELPGEQPKLSLEPVFADDLKTEIVNLSAQVEQFKESWDRTQIQSFSELNKRVEGLETNVVKLYDSFQDLARALDKVADELNPTFIKRDQSKEKVLKNIYIKLWEGGFHPSLIRKWMKNLAEDLEKANNTTSEKIENQALEFIARKLVEFVPSCEPSKIRSFKRLALVGPSGTGKTTTLAKLVVDWFDQGMRPTIAFWEREDSISLGNLLKPFGISSSTIKSWEDLKRCLADSDFPAVVDFCGISPRYKSDLERFQDMCSTFDFDVHLCLPANISFSEARWLANQFEQFHPNSVVITKLDECQSPAGILQGISENKIPLSIFTTGREIPGNFEIATPERLAAMILGLD